MYARHNSPLLFLAIILLASVCPINAHAQSELEHLRRCTDLLKQGSDALSKGWKLTAKSWEITGHVPDGATFPEYYRYDPANTAWTHEDDAERTRQFERVVAVERERLTDCRDLMDSYDEALALYTLGRGLTGLS